MDEYLKMVSDAEVALEAGDTEKADELMAKAEKVKANLERGDALKALKDDAEARKAVAAQVEADKRKAEIDAEVAKQVEAQVAEATKNLGVQRPEYSEESETADITPSLFLSRLQVGSRLDRLPLIEQAIKYQRQRLAYRQGLEARAPNERLFRALCVKAGGFLKQEDEIARLDRNGEAFKCVVPAFDPDLLGKLGVRGDEENTIEMDGLVLDTFGQKGVTQSGIEGLKRLAGAKANELVHSTQANYGDEWVPTLMDAVLWRTVRMQARVLSVLPQFDMTSNPQDVAIESTDPTYYKVGETTAETQMAMGTGMPIPDSKIGTAKVTFSATKIGALTMWSEEEAEDSPINIEDQFRDQYGVSMAHTLDEVMLHGDETTDTTNISNQGTSLTSNSRYLAVDGLRHEPMVTTTADKHDTGALTVDDLVSVQGKMGTNAVFGYDPTQLVVFCDPPTGLQFRKLDEVITVDKFGPQATILTGQVGSVMGIPILAVQKYHLTDATGHIDDTPGDNVKGSFVVVNRMGVRVGWKRRPRIAIAYLPFADAWYIVTTCRLDIGFKEAGMVGLGFNITV